jgi:hypothetical protein
VEEQQHPIGMPLWLEVEHRASGAAGAAGAHTESG